MGESCRQMLQLVQRPSDGNDHVVFKASDSRMAFKEDVL